MKLEIWDESKKKEEKFFLKLRGPDHDGDFQLLVVDQDGRFQDDLLWIGPKGIVRSSLVNRKWGFAVDVENGGLLRVER